MENADAIAALLEYDHWCTDQLAARMETLPSGDIVREFPIGLHTLHATLYHVVCVAEVWTDRSRPDPTGLRWMKYSASTLAPGSGSVSVSELRERYQAAGRQMLANLAALHAETQPAPEVAWLIRRNHLLQITTHGMHHRAQMIFMLTQLGVAGLIEGGDFGGWANGPLKDSADRASIARFLY